MRLVGKTRSVFERCNIVSEGDLKEAVQKLNEFAAGKVTGKVAVAVSGGNPVTLPPRSSPIHEMSDTIAAYRPDVSHSCQGRKTSVIRAAAKSTIARTTQLMTVL